MEFTNGVVIDKPKTVYWVEMPASIHDSDRIELLKNDILMVDYRMNQGGVTRLKEKDPAKTGFFYNLDDILFRNQIREKDVHAFTAGLAAFIKGHQPDRSVVHTSIIDKTISASFNGSGITFIERNLKDRKNALEMVQEMTKVIFANDESNKRAALRLNLYPASVSKVEIVNLRAPDKPVPGILKDISLSGIGILLHDRDSAEQFKLKDLLQVKIFTPRALLKLNLSIVTRIDPEKLEMGLHFNINDTRMIKDTDASIITGMIYQWIKDLMKENGDLKTDLK
jgi:hypothetical protein